MSDATLIRDIIAYEQEDDSATKHFPSGSLIKVDDTDEGWFLFEDMHGIWYECEEQPEEVLRYENANIQQNNVSNQSTTAYTPVPNMTPLERKFLLL